MKMRLLIQQYCVCFRCGIVMYVVSDALPYVDSYDGPVNEGFDAYTKPREDTSYYRLVS